MATIDQSKLVGKIRDRPISKELQTLHFKAASATEIDTVFMYSDGQPGSDGRTTGSTGHNGGRAADLFPGLPPVFEILKAMGLGDGASPTAKNPLITIFSAILGWGGLGKIEKWVMKNENWNWQY